MPNKKTTMSYGGSCFRSYLNQWLSKDPFAGYANLPQSQNGYNYANNNPVNLTDPSGLCAENSDEVCWAVYETIVREFPQAQTKLYYYNYEYRGLAELPENRLRNILRELTLSRPYVYDKVIQLEATRFGLPTEILFGVLEAEIQLDTDDTDVIGDLFLELFPSGAEFINIGPGVGNIHLPTVRTTAEHFQDNYAGCQTTISLDINPNESATSLGQRLLDVDFNIRVMAAHIRQMADYRFGANRQPLLTSHAELSEWALQDAIAIWHGYRYGVPEVSPGRIFGFENLSEFQNRTYSLNELIYSVVIGPDAQNSTSNAIPIFRRLGLREKSQ